MTNLLTNANKQTTENKPSGRKIFNLKAEKLLRQANDNFIYFKDYEMALMLLQEALELDPENANAYILKGTILFCVDERETALQCLEKAIEINPVSVEAHSLKANILDIEGNLEEALVSCDRAFINVTPKNCDFLTPLFDQKLAILIKMKKYREANNTLKQCCKYLRTEDSSYLFSCYGDLINSLQKKKRKRRQLASERFKLLS